MYTEKDVESINKAADVASLLEADLRSMFHADDPLLGEMASMLRNDAKKLHDQLERIRQIVTRSDDPVCMPNEAATMSAGGSGGDHSCVPHDESWGRWLILPPAQTNWRGKDTDSWPASVTRAKSLTANCRPPGMASSSSRRSIRPPHRRCGR